jgi:peptidyl-prolyl cis-trans isomerase D
MLKVMRQHAKYFYVLFFIVILSFIFWGVGTVDNKAPNIVAEVGKHKISAEEFWRAYDRANKYYRDLYQDKFDEEMQEKLKIEDTVLKSLINTKLLLIAADEFGISVTTEELHEALVNDPAFSKDGVFDRNIYLNTLRLSRITPEAYESLKHQELLINKVSRLIELSFRIPEDEISSISADEQTMKAIRNAVIGEEKAKVLDAYLNGLKKNIEIKVYKELI